MQYVIIQTHHKDPKTVCLAKVKLSGYTSEFIYSI